MDEYEALEEVQSALSDTDPVRDERDVLFVANYAMEEAGLRQPSEILLWMNRQLALARKSGFYEPQNHMAPAVPEIQVLSRYLRYLKSGEGQPIR